MASSSPPNSSNLTLSLDSLRLNNEEEDKELNVTQVHTCDSQLQTLDLEGQAIKENDAASESVVRSKISAASVTPASKEDVEKSSKETHSPVPKSQDEWRVLKNNLRDLIKSDHDNSADISNIIRESGMAGIQQFVWKKNIINADQSKETKWCDVLGYALSATGNYQNLLAVIHAVKDIFKQNTIDDFFDWMESGSVDSLFWFNTFLSGNRDVLFNGINIPQEDRMKTLLCDMFSIFDNDGDYLFEWVNRLKLEDFMPAENNAHLINQAIRLDLTALVCRLLSKLKDLADKKVSERRLLSAMARQLPQDIDKYSMKIVHECIHFKDAEGNTILHYADKYPNMTMILNGREYLSSQSFYDASIENNKGLTPVQVLIKSIKNEEEPNNTKLVALYHLIRKYDFEKNTPTGKYTYKTKEEDVVAAVELLKHYQFKNPNEDRNGSFLYRY